MASQSSKDYETIELTALDSLNITIESINLSEDMS